MFFGTSPCFRVSRSAGVSGFIILYNITIKLKPFHRMMYIYLQEKTYSGWLSKKQFPFNEKLAMHLLHYQQVRYIIKVGFVFKAHFRGLNNRKSKNGRSETPIKTQFYILGGIFSPVYSLHTPLYTSYILC